MTRWLTVCLVLVAAVPAVSGCGGGATSSSNQAKIESAEEGAESVAGIEATLTSELGMKPDGSGVAVGEWTGRGGPCTVLLIATAGEVAAYEGDEWFVTAPDGSAGIKVVPTGKDVADCLREVTEALGW